MQYVVLAGGLGTRLRGTIPDAIPKPMAEIAGRPLLEWLLDGAVADGADDVVLLVGHRAGVVRAHFGSEHRGVPVRYVEEHEPLGTGGAIAAALPVLEDRFVVANGDTFVAADPTTLVERLDDTPFTMTLADVPDVSRFGGVVVEDGCATALTEKGGTGRGLVNAGVYGMRRSLVESFPDGASSFERDVMEPGIGRLRPDVVIAEGTFFDIGVPDDYRAADIWFRERAERHGRPRHGRGGDVA